MPDRPVPDAAGRRPPPRAGTADMSRTLDFYLALGCEVVRAADGWVLLSGGSVRFLLVRAPAPGDEPAAAPWIRLSTPDVRVLRRRLQHDGVPTGALSRPAHAPLGEIVVLDPDRRPVAIRQPEQVPRPAAPGGRSRGPHPARRGACGTGAQPGTLGRIAPGRR